MKTPRDHAESLMFKASHDLIAARAILSAGDAFDTACFHAQQAVEIRYEVEFEPSDGQAAEALQTASEVYELIKRVVDKA